MKSTSSRLGVPPRERRRRPIHVSSKCLTSSVPNFLFELKFDDYSGLFAELAHNGSRSLRVGEHFAVHRSAYYQAALRSGFKQRILSAVSRGLIGPQSGEDIAIQRTSQRLFLRPLSSSRNSRIHGVLSFRLPKTF